MKLGKDVVEKCHRFDIGLSKKEYETLKNYGLEQVKSDDEALINYAVNKILADAVKKGSK